jgi:hypothetical protein
VVGIFRTLCSRLDDVHRCNYDIPVKQHTHIEPLPLR